METTKECASCGLQKPLSEYETQRHRCKACRSHQKRLRLFNITAETYDKMYDDQNGQCAICGIHQSQLTRRFDIDHCHETGQIRGLLCSPCNTGLGKFYDNENNIRRAAEYLRTAKERL